MSIDKAQQRYGIAIIHDIPSDEELHLMSTDVTWEAISFLNQHDEKQLHERCKYKNITINKITRIRDILEKFGLQARKRYTKFMANWPEQTLVDEIPFKEQFTHRGEISYWWLTNASVKQNEVSNTFEYLCYLEIIDSIMSYEHNYCVYTGQDPLLSLLISRICEKYNLEYKTNKHTKVKFNNSLKLGGVSRLWFAVKLMVAWVFFKAFRFSLPEFSSNTVGFYTIYPSTLTLSPNGAKDRNYKQLPELINNRSDASSLFLVSFQPKSIKHWATVLKSALNPRSLPSPNYIFLEQFLQFRDILSVLANLIFVAQYKRLHKNNYNFLNSFKYLGINVYELIGPEQSKCLLGNQLPDSITLANLIERCISRYPVKYLICFLELYPSARAIYYGASKGLNTVKTIAYQHASINSMKLWYNYSETELTNRNDKVGTFINGMPIPDAYFFQGQLGQNIIVDSGYPLDRSVITGSPRYDNLAQRENNIDTKQLSRSGHCKHEPNKSTTVRILIVPSLSLSDSLGLIEAVLQAWKRSHKYYEKTIPIEMIIKPHPSVTLTNEILNLSDRYNCGCISESLDDLYDLILNANIVITSYSTAGEEAIALKTPVICYSGTKVTISSFIDIPAAPIAHDSEELDDMIKKIIDTEGNPFHDPNFIEQYKTHWPRLVDNAFYKLDARASERMIAELFKS